VSIFGDTFKVKADIRQIESMSAHADYNDLCQYLSILDPGKVKQVFIIHGEPDAQDEFRDKLIRKGFLDVIIPDRHETYGL
jgi:metallo-beta-lactamase family protein